MSLFLSKSVQVTITKYPRFEIFKQQAFISYCFVTKQSKIRILADLGVDESFFPWFPDGSLFNIWLFFDELGCRKESVSFFSLPFYTRTLIKSQE